jgi:hypothetical protein
MSPPPVYKNIASALAGDIEEGNKILDSYREADSEGG